jgi:flagellar P-ring protein precursor FlgI
MGVWTDCKNRLRACPPRRLFAAAAMVAAIAAAPGDGLASSRIKDIATVEGVRENVLIGYGLVVGLNQTGDKTDDINFTKESLIAMLERLGVNTRDGKVDTKNLAAVMVTATLPPFARQGTRIDVTVAAMGKASSLQGGTLLVTPLIGADGEVYAVAQGNVAIGGYSASGQGQSVVKAVPTSGRIANGAIIEREIPFSMNSMQDVKLSLRSPDFTTARRIAQAVNAFLGTRTARAIDPSTVQMVIPPGYSGNVVDMVTDVEQLRVEPDQPARVVIDERSGIIVIGSQVRISEVAIAQGNLTIRVTETPQVSQPAPFSTTGTTTTVPRTDIQVDEDKNKRLAIVNEGVSLQELVDGLNALGVGPRDMIGILQAIKAAGALNAEIEVM